MLWENMAMEFKRKVSRYQFSSGRTKAFDGFEVIRRALAFVTGESRIPRQERLEVAAFIIPTRGRVDSHTTMINGLGTLVGGSVALKRRCHAGPAVTFSLRMSSVFI